MWDPGPCRKHLLADGCRAVLDMEGVREGEISVTLLNDEGIQKLNRDYFGKDRPTDVIAFALHARGEPVLGDIYVGFEQALRQASELELPLEEELLRLVIHGALHVLGYKHPDGEDRIDSEMFQETGGASQKDPGTGRGLTPLFRPGSSFTPDGSQACPFSILWRVTFDSFPIRGDRRRSSQGSRRWWGREIWMPSGRS